MFVLVVHYCVQLFFEVKKNPNSFSPFLFLSFANTFLFFTFLAPFFWNSPNAQFPKYLMPYSKPVKKKTALKQFFKGVVHEQP